LLFFWHTFFSPFFPPRFLATCDVQVQLEFREFDGDYEKLELKAMREKEARELQRAHHRRAWMQQRRDDEEAARLITVNSSEGGGGGGTCSDAQTLAAEAATPSPQQSKPGRVKATLMATGVAVDGFGRACVQRVRRYMVHKILHSFVDGDSSVGMVVDRLDALEDDSLSLCPVHGDRCVAIDEGPSGTPSTPAPFAVPTEVCKSRISNWNLGEVFLT
jgi:hypothetical protein